MKCQHCLLREANFHSRSNINGQITERHLCAECAGALEGGFFAGALTGPMEALFQASPLRSPLFGGGLMGAHTPFAPLRRGPELLLERIPLETPGPQRALVPTEADESLKQRRALNVLRQEMERAVEAEDFERAAQLRDEISRLERM